MAVEWLRFSLRGYGGEQPTGTHFFELLCVTAADGYDLQPSNSPWRAAIIELLMVDMEECRDAPEPSEEFVSRIDSGLRRVAARLALLPLSAFDEWRTLGKEADIFIGGWMNSDQFDLTLPPEFLFQCGRLGLPIQICTND